MQTCRNIWLPHGRICNDKKVYNFKDGNMPCCVEGGITTAATRLKHLER